MLSIQISPRSLEIDWEDVARISNLTPIIRQGACGSQGGRPAFSREQPTSGQNRWGLRGHDRRLQMSESCQCRFLCFLLWRVSLALPDRSPATLGTSLGRSGSARSNQLLIMTADRDQSLPGCRHSYLSIVGAVTLSWR